MSNQNIYKGIVLLFAILAAIFILSSCDNNTSTENNYARLIVINNTAKELIVHRYENNDYAGGSIDTLSAHKTGTYKLNEYSYYRCYVQYKQPWKLIHDLHLNTLGSDYMYKVEVN